MASLHKQYQLQLPTAGSVLWTASTSIWSSAELQFKLRSKKKKKIASAAPEPKKEHKILN